MPRTPVEVNLEETLPLQEKSLKFAVNFGNFSSSIDLWGNSPVKLFDSTHHMSRVFTVFFSWLLYLLV